MKWKCSKSEFILILIIIALVVCRILDIGFGKINENNETIEVIDTTYNYIIIDSIKYDIKIKDSIIYNIKYKYETEYIKAENLDDSSAVELFKALCTDDSLYGGENTI